jgi:RNA polymerase sigma factor for flagellar operon FliA
MTAIAISTSSKATIMETISLVDAVLGVVGRHLPSQVSREDLASVGKVALVEALLCFNGPTDEVRAYCYTRVRGAMLDELRRMDPLSRRARAKASAVHKAREGLERELGRAPTDIEIANAVGLSQAAVRETAQLSIAADTCSLNSDDAGGFAFNSLVDADAVSPAASVETEEVTDCIKAALTRLPANYAHVLRRYHLDDATLEEISIEIGVTSERVRQIRIAAERRMREDFIVMALWQAVFSKKRDTD